MGLLQGKHVRSTSVSFSLFVYVLYIKYIEGNYLNEVGRDFEEPGLVEDFPPMAEGLELGNL